MEELSDSTIKVLSRVLESGVIEGEVEIQSEEEIKAVIEFLDESPEYAGGTGNMSIFIEDNVNSRFLNHNV